MMCCAAWWPTSTAGRSNRVTPADLEDSRRRLESMAAEAGRDPKSITISVYGHPPDGNAVRSYLDAGAVRVVVRLEHVANEYEVGRQLVRMADGGAALGGASAAVWPGARAALRPLDSRFRGNYWE